MFGSEIPAVKQFLAGATRGPIGMSEEADQGRKAVSTSGMTVAETEELEREAVSAEASRAEPDAGPDGEPEDVPLGELLREEEI
jgi:hypothetical protein